MILPRIDEVLAQIEWPELQRMPSQLGPDDTLVTCAGFEDRALAFLDRAVIGNSRGFHVIGIDYRPEVAENRIVELRDLVTRATGTITRITYERQNPCESGSDILAQANGATRIIVDISGMSRLLIVQLVAASVREQLLHKMAIVYTEAQVYPPTCAEVEAKIAHDQDYLGIFNFISSGVFGVTVVPELSTVAMQGQPVRLVAFPSFNPTQLAAVCAEIQASFYSVINGIPPRSQNVWRRDAIRRLNNLDSIPEREEFDASTLDYRETLRLLLDIYAKHGAVEKIVISPTGSKMQAVAVGVLCGFLRDIQVVYPTPRSFPAPSNYTQGALDTFQLSLEAFSSVPVRSSELDDDGD
jgi:hypothetical protein